MIDLNKMSREKLIDELRNIEYRLAMVMDDDLTVEELLKWLSERSSAAGQEVQP